MSTFIVMAPKGGQGPAVTKSLPIKVLCKHLPDKTLDQFSKFWSFRKQHYLGMLSHYLLAGELAVSKLPLPLIRHVHLQNAKMATAKNLFSRL